MTFVKTIYDDSSPISGPRLRVIADNQGDIHLHVIEADGKNSSSIRLCGPGGGSRYTGLAYRLIAAFNDAEDPIEIKFKS
jgi:hypothetical protein